MKIINLVLSFFKNNRTLGIAIGVALASLLLNLKQCKSARDLRKEVAVAQHNINALNDTIRITKDRQGRDEYDKLALLTDKVSNLEKLNQDLAKEVKAIKGKTATIIKGDVQIVHDTVPLIVKGELVDSTVRADFDFSKDFSPGNFRKMSGYTKYDLRTGNATGQLTSDTLGIRFVTGIKNLDKGKPEIFLKSNYPGFSVTQLDGAVLDPKLFQKKKTPLITTGLNIGYTPVTYDLRTKQFDFNPTRVSVTAGINVNILKLFRR